MKRVALVTRRFVLTTNYGWTVGMDTTDLSVILNGMGLLLDQLNKRFPRR